ncbi:MAG TPA: hypothetical protein VFK86_12900, partial [Bauldia sp.]|nr:hypothetical protein [Bauldia sp.]
TLLGERYAETVAITIRESQTLKDLQAKIAQQELETAAKSERDQLFQKLVDYDPTLSALLSARKASSSPGFTFILTTLKAVSALPLDAIV